MPKYKSLVNYKIGYKPDAPKKTKNIEIEDNGATTTYAIPVVSGDKDIEFQVQEQLPIFFSLAKVDSMGKNEHVCKKSYFCHYSHYLGANYQFFGGHLGFQGSNEVECFLA